MSWAQTLITYTGWKVSDTSSNNNDKGNKNSKDAGFVYESLRNETNQVIWDFCLHETNPRNESFKNESTKQIHNTNL